MTSWGRRVLEGLEAESAGCSSWNLVDNFVDKWVDALPAQAHTERVKEGVGMVKEVIEERSTSAGLRIADGFLMYIQHQLLTQGYDLAAEEVQEARARILIAIEEIKRTVL